LTARRTGLGPKGDSTGRLTHQGIRIMMYSRQMAVSTGRSPGEPPCRVIHPAEENTRTAAVSTSACAAWMARAAVSARHHQRAAHAVCGSA
jgi:hypothetical protein